MPFAQVARRTKRFHIHNELGDKLMTMDGESKESIEQRLAEGELDTEGDNPSPSYVGKECNMLDLQEEFAFILVEGSYEYGEGDIHVSDEFNHQGNIWKLDVLGDCINKLQAEYDRVHDDEYKAQSG